MLRNVSLIGDRANRADGTETDGHHCGSAAPWELAASPADANEEDGDARNTQA